MFISSRFDCFIRFQLIDKFHFYKPTYLFNLHIFSHCQEKLDFTSSFSHMSCEFREQLNREFFDLVDSLICSIRSPPKDVDDDDVVMVKLLPNYQDIY